MRPWNTSTEDDLRRLLDEWDPIGVADDVRDEYDCMLTPLLQRLRPRRMRQIHPGGRRAKLAGRS